MSQDISGDEASLERELGLHFSLSLSLFSLHENWLSVLLPPDGRSWLSRLSGPWRVGSGSELGYPGSDPDSSTNRLCDLDQERNLRVPQFPHLLTVVNVIDLNRIVLSRSIVSDSATPWTVAHQAPLSMGFSRQEHWSGLALPPLGDLPEPGIKPTSPAFLLSHEVYH